MSSRKPRIMKKHNGRTRKVSKFAPEEVISSMPDNVMTNIMDRLQIQDAVRTSVLSKNWRSKWTLLSQLVFDIKFLDFIGEKEDQDFYGRIITRLILDLKGPVTKFVVYTNKQFHSILGVQDITFWVLFLWRSGIKDFTLVNMDEAPLVLPIYLFCCRALKNLELHNCCLGPMPIFCRFPNLLSLDLSHMQFLGGYTCGQLITRCPLLETLKLIQNTPGKIELYEIAGHVNLKVLNLPLCELENKGVIIRSSTIFQLIQSFPKLKELTLDFLDFKLPADPELRLPTVFPCLKILTLYGVDFRSSTMVSCVTSLICDSPSLEDLMIVSEYDDEVPPPAPCSSEVDDRRMEQLQLKSVIFVCSGVLKNEKRLIKALLSCSPLLKVMRVGHYSSQEADGENVKLIFARKLLKLHRASPIAEVKLICTKSKLQAVVICDRLQNRLQAFP